MYSYSYAQCKFQKRWEKKKAHEMERYGGLDKYLKRKTHSYEHSWRKKRTNTHALKKSSLEFVSLFFFYMFVCALWWCRLLFKILSQTSNEMFIPMTWLHSLTHILSISFHREESHSRDDNDNILFAKECTRMQRSYLSHHQSLIEKEKLLLTSESKRGIKWIEMNMNMYMNTEHIFYRVLYFIVYKYSGCCFFSS